VFVVIHGDRRVCPGTVLIVNESNPRTYISITELDDRKDVTLREVVIKRKKDVLGKRE
jgi:hypothetical protein